MKILLISKHAGRGGAAIATYRLMEALKANSIDVRLLAQEEDSRKTGNGRKGVVVGTTKNLFKKWIDLCRFLLERIVFLRHERSPEIRFLFSLANTGEKLSKNRYVREADIIHLHWINAGFLSLRSLKGIFELGKPVVWTFHDMWAFTGGCHYALECENYTRECGNCTYLKNPGPNDLSHRIWKKKEKLFRDKTFTVITPSNWLQECVKASSLLGHCEVHTIHNPIDQTLFKPVEKIEACSNLGLDPEKKYILFGAATIGNMLKGFDYFVEAIRLLAADLDEDSGVEILLFGKSRGDLAHYFPLKSNQVAFTGSSQTIVELYSASHLFVIPSLQDNLPNTIVESMLCGTPVVGFDSGGIPEMIDHRVNGYLAEYRSSSDLARGMAWVLSSGDYGALSAEARSAAVKRFSRERAAEKHVELYKQLLDPKNKA